MTSTGQKFSRSFFLAEKKMFTPFASPKNPGQPRLVKPRKPVSGHGRFVMPLQRMGKILTFSRLRQLSANDGWLMKILLVMAGGSIGALSRYAVSLLAARLLGTRFPWGTLVVNLSGCFLIGLAFALAERGLNIMNPSMRLFFVTGYLGALTTFSTFGLETVNALREGTYMISLSNFLANNVLGAALVFLSMLLGRWR
jgi:CrcB protein